MIDRYQQRLDEIERANARWAARAQQHTPRPGNGGGLTEDPIPPPAAPKPSYADPEEAGCYMSGEQGSANEPQRVASGNSDEPKPVADPKRSRAELLLAAWLRRKLPLRDYLLGTVFCTTSRWLIFGDTGIGKTLFALSMAGAMASGRSFLGWAGKRRARVMYLDGEMPAETFKERMKLVADECGVDLAL
jgi:hypothetical protein